MEPSLPSSSASLTFGQVVLPSSDTWTRNGQVRVFGKSRSIRATLSLAIHCSVTLTRKTTCDGSGASELGREETIGIDASRSTDTNQRAGVLPHGPRRLRAAMDHGCPPGGARFGFDPRRQLAIRILTIYTMQLPYHLRHVQRCGFDWPPWRRRLNGGL